METTRGFVKCVIFLTGADGFVGSHLIKRLVKFDADVHVFVRATSSGELRNIRHLQDEITAWGTGEPTREFLYVKDAAEGILDATERYDESEPVNLGSEMEIGIREPVETIANLTGFEGEVEWDTSKPDGQPRRRLDVSRGKERFGWEASTEFEGVSKDY